MVKEIDIIAEEDKETIRVSRQCYKDIIEYAEMNGHCDETWDQILWRLLDFYDFHKNNYDKIYYCGR